MLNPKSHPRIIAVTALIAALASCTVAKRPDSDSDSTQVQLCDVASVYDGDTIWVECEGKREKIRLWCIDAPEMQQKPWGKQSRDHLRGLLGSTVGIDRKDTDRYGRTVAKLWTGTEDTTARMVADGWAVAYPKYCPKSERAYYDAEPLAETQQKGVWSKRGLQSAPWEWRAAKRAARNSK